ncbi:MAG: UvrD-helicase domain-containing protein, partial [Deltaproteobacteria bacterium]|nr:UvrD-helicase domain-containing protein [Deltaproteobacteria bacterium]
MVGCLFYSAKEVIILKEIQLNPQQVEAVSHKDGPMIVLSVAGSGKTMVLITVSILSYWYPKL